MHTAALHLAPILGAEKSKVPFYIAAGVLVAWALVVSLGLGLRISNFPRTLAAQRVVVVITVVIVIATAASDVLTSSSPAPAQASSAAPAGSATQTSTAPAPSTPSVPAAPSTPSTPAAPSVPAKTKSGSAPKATTGTPAPPSSPANAAPSAPLKLAANPEGQLSYNTKQLRAKAGKVTITMANMSPIEHDVAIAQGSTVLGQTPVFKDGSKTLTLTLKPGTYTFYCTVPGHRQAGMEGTLTVSS